MASPRAPDQLRGLTFAPRDAELIKLYLHRKVSGCPLPAATARYVHDADVYAAEPEALVAGILSASAKNEGEDRAWYFFTSVRAKSSGDARRNRSVAGGAGTWHSEKARHGVVDGDDGGVVVGYRQFFTYEPKNGWLMAEFSLDDPHRGEDMPVLCKIYKTRRAGRSASTPIPSISGSKRKAAAADERSGESSSARIRRCLRFPNAPDPPTLAASSEIQEAFLVLPIERPQEPPVRTTLTATPPTPSFPMAADHHALNFLLPAQDWPAPENSHLSLSDMWTPGNYSFDSSATSDQSCYNAFLPSAPISSYGTTFLPHCQDWLTPESSQASEASTLENYSYFSPDHATSKPTALPMITGFWSFPQDSELSAIFGV